MQFETFNRDETTRLTEPAGPLVRVSTRGMLLFNRPAVSFLEEQYGAGPQLEVALLFSAESRTAGVRPLADSDDGVLAGARWHVRRHRSLSWPAGVQALEFVQRHQIGDGEYPASLLRGPGPRMLTFAARAMPRSPARVRRLASATRAR